jgi:CPA2 family monovalent cation:H+ antiporter-2
LLRENGIEPCIIEMNLETVRQLRNDGNRAVYGDAIHLDTLQSAGVDRAGTLILSVAGIPGTEEVIRQARSLNPDIHILVRSNYLRDVSGLLEAGATQVFSGEGEVALSMAVAMLRDLGATPDQIDRERARVRTDLFGGEAPNGALPIGKTWRETGPGEASAPQEMTPGRA